MIALDVSLSDILACPIRSLEASHYGDHGGCKCPQICAQCGELIRRSSDRDVPWVHSGTGNAFCLVDGSLPLFVDQDDSRDIADPELRPIPKNMECFALDATCPGCGHPERVTPIDRPGSRFGCRKCDYVSKERDA